MKNQIPTRRRIKLDPYLSLCTLILISSWRWIKDITVMPETLKLLEENTDKILQDINMGKDFPKMSQISQEAITRIQKLDSKNFWSEETAYIMRESLCRLHIRWKILYVQYKRNYKKLPLKPNHPINNWDNVMNRYFSKENHINRKNIWKVFDTPDHHSNVNQIALRSHLIPSLNSYPQENKGQMLERTWRMKKHNLCWWNCKLL